ncbi:non-ribosomal peptide synthetase [Sorangium sp. So ce1389]|uniref:non-ribosomal peptide synthetase n=1 Tax=Sorangium sp. So ce1389 TaxID=3133336 RepID=UPI003F61C157
MPSTILAPAMAHKADADETIDAVVRRNLERAGSSELRVKTYSGVYVKLGYAEYVARALRWTAYYRGAGLRPAARVAIILPHSFDAYAAYLGATLGGYVPVHMHFPSPRLSRSAYARAVGPMAKEAGVEIVMTYSDLVPLLRGCLSARGERSVPVVEAGTLALPDPASLDDHRAEPSDVAFLQLSSGTTGARKAVAVRQRAIVRHVAAYARRLSITAADRIVSWLPLYHDLGLVTSLWIPALERASLVAMSPFEWVRNPTSLLQAISRFRGTLCWMPNFAFMHLCKAARLLKDPGWDLSTIRGLVNGAEPVLESTRRRFVEAFAPYGLEPEALWTIYGMAEVILAATSGDAGHPPRADAVDPRAFAEEGRAVPGAPGAAARVNLSSGAPLDEVAIEVVGPDGRALPERRVGEIVIRSPYLVDGYLGGGAFEGGAIASGDLGYLADGHLFVTGRKKDVIILAGRNVLPEDIESLVNDVDGVIAGRVAALGVDDDDLGTERLLVIAETRVSSPAERERVRAEIDAAVRGSAEVGAGAVFLAPPGWLLKSPSGKLARRANLEKYLREIAPRPAGGAIAEPGAGDAPEARLRRVIASVLPAHHAARVERLTLDEKLLESGLFDSLSLVHLMVAIERAFGLDLPEHELLDVDHNFDRLGHLLAWLGRLAADRATSRAEASAPSPLPQEGVVTVRSFKAEAYLGSSRRHDLLILGSSRSMNLGSRVAAELGYRSFNFSVNRARAEDYHAALHRVLGAGKAELRRVLVGIDVDSLSNATPFPDPALAECAELRGCLDARDRRACEESGRSPDRFEHLLRRQRRESEAHRVFTYDPESGDQIFLNSNIHHTRQRTFMSRSPESYFNTLSLQLAGFTALHRPRLRYLRRVVSLCRARGIEVTCFLNPMHPRLVEFAVEHTTYAARRRELEAFFARRLPETPLVDCSVPSRFGGDDDDFEDAGHIMPYNADVLLRRLLRPSRLD